MRLALDREPGDVERPHQRRLIHERVVLGRREHHRVGRLVKSAGDSPAARRIEPHFAGPRSMTLGQEVQLRAGEERVVGRDARLIRGEDVRQVIEFDGDARDPLRVDAPGLLTDLRGPQLAAVRLGDPEAKDVLRVVLDHVPAGRPDRQRQLERRLVDVPDVGGHVKELARDVGDLDRVLDGEPSILRQRRRRDEDAQRPGETPISVRMSGLLEQQTRSNHRRQHHTGDEQPCAGVAPVQGVTKADAILDPHRRVVRVEIDEAADFPRVVGRGVSVNVHPRSGRDRALTALHAAQYTARRRQTPQESKYTGKGTDDRLKIQNNEQ